MNADFPRILSLLRKEKKISQKAAAKELGISQALLSHYEKGIRECGLDFLCRVADFYGVSCDYLLGRSADRTGITLSVEDIPEPDRFGRDNVYSGSVLPVLNKKLISNSLVVLFDLLASAGSKALTAEVSAFLMLSVYRMFRAVYLLGNKNQDELFALPKHLAVGYSDSAMQIAETNARAIAQGLSVPGLSVGRPPHKVAISSESLSSGYPLFASSLMNLIRASEPAR
jgi:transcriptional regulator with XRE-family HTH domain